MNPLIPGPVDVLLSLAVFTAMAFALAALFSWVGHFRQLDFSAALGWLALILLVPVAGPLAWFWLGRTTKSQRQTM
jgi:membrane-associated phospholipid phosphatase